MDMAGFDALQKVDPVELPGTHKPSGDRPLVDMTDPSTTGVIKKAQAKSGAGAYNVAEYLPPAPANNGATERPADATSDHIPVKDGGAVNRRPNGDRFDQDGTAFKFSLGQLYVTDSKDQDVAYARNRSAGPDRSYNNGAYVHFGDPDMRSGDISYKGHRISFKDDRITNVDGLTIPPYKGK